MHQYNERAIVWGRRVSWSGRTPTGDPRPPGSGRQADRLSVGLSEHSEIDNPAARYVQRLTDHDAARFIGFDPSSKQLRYNARRALERLAADGVIEIEPAGRGQFRVFAPGKPQTP